MKWAVRLLCSITGLFLMTSLGESTFKPKCENYVLPGCPRNFNPICGTDGETYANECLLCMMNREYNKDVKIARLSSCS